MYYTMFVMVIFSIFPLLHLSSAVFRRDINKTEIQPLIQKGFTILVPCYNEQNVLKTTLAGLLQLDYTNYDVIFINDGSTDTTLEVLKELLLLEKHAVSLDTQGITFKQILNVYHSKNYPNIFVIDKLNGGKADSLNAGISYSQREYVVTLDADSVLDEKSLLHINRHLTENTDVIATGGTVRILQGWKRNNNSRTNFSFKVKHIIRFQILEYMSGFLVLKNSLAHKNALLVISGAFGVFTRDVLIKINGFRQTIGEDIDITLRMHQYSWAHKKGKISYVKEAVCYTECPESWADLHKQRIRWQKAFMDALYVYKFKLIKYMFRPAALFLYFDAFLFGTVATFGWLVNWIWLFIVPPHEQELEVAIYVCSTTIMSFGFTVVSLILAWRTGERYSLPDYFSIGWTLVLNLLFYRLFYSYLLIVGSLSYFLPGSNQWNKVKRSGRQYMES